jgi:hypothetical protein
MSRILVLAVAAVATSAALAQHIYRYVGPDGRVTYSDEPPSTGRYVNVPPPGSANAPGTIQQGAVPIAPNQPLPTAITPSGSAPSTIPASAVPGPGSDSTSGRVVPGTVGPNSSDRQVGLSPDEQRIDRDAAQRNIMQGERAREAEAVRLNVEQGEAARMRSDVQTNVPAGEAAQDRRDMQTNVPTDEQAREREAVKLNQ